MAMNYRADSPKILLEFLSYHETVKAHSQKTVDEYYLDLRNFFRYMKQLRDPALADCPLDEIDIRDIGIEFIGSITLTDVYSYLAYLSRDRLNRPNSEHSDKGLSASTRARKVATLRSFFNYLCNKVHLLPDNPIKDIDSPKIKKTLPRYLTLDESVRLLHRYFPGCAITTDVITGFPGETEEDFEETMDVVQQVLCGKVNKHLVSIINNLGGKAIGLCGLDGALFQAKKLDEKYGLVGKIVKVEPQVVHDALNCGYIPVVSTVALGIDNDTAYNINADTAAAELAISLGAEKLILLTDVRGVLKDPKDDSTLISQIRLNEVPGLLASGIIGGGMIPKIECCVNALERGVHRTHILDGRIPHSILTEMLSHKGIGTMLWE